MDKGAYLLWIRSKGFMLRVGKLGLIYFEKGYYAYVGSAMGGLRARIRRHLSRQKRMHWHIDYMLASNKALLVSISLFPTRKRNECRLSCLLAEIADEFVKGFGCSDCSCKSHLYYFRKMPGLSPRLKKF